MKEKKLRGRVVELLQLIGYCGEFPMELLDRVEGYRDHNRRLVTRLVRDGLVKERKFVDRDRHVVRSLSITGKGIDALGAFDPECIRDLREHIFVPADGQGDKKKTFRLHRHAHCLMLAIEMGASWLPGEYKVDNMGTELVYYSTYEWNKLCGRDSKGSRASGIFISPYGFSPVYYLGSHNMVWNKEAENSFAVQVWFDLMHLHYDCRKELGCLFVGRSWDLVESLVVNGTSGWSRLIPVKNKEPMYYIAENDDGRRLARMLLKRWPGELYYRVKKLDRRAELHFEYKFDLECLAEFYKPKLLFPRNVGFFFPFQMEVMERLNRVGAELIPLPMELLDDYYDQGNYEQ